MKHYTEDELTAYLDKEMPPELQATITAHLSQCDECAQKLAEWSSLHSFLAYAPKPEPSEEFVSSILKRVGVEDHTNTTRRFWTDISHWLVPGFEFALAAALLVFAGHHSETALLDSDMVLLAGLEEDVTQNAFLESSDDFITLLDVNVEDL